MKLIIKSTILDRTVELPNHGLYIPRKGEIINVENFETEVSQVLWNFSTGEIIITCY